MAKKKLIRVRYIGLSTIRVIEPYVWNPENEYIQEVPLETAAELVTYPGKQFELLDPDVMPEIISFVEGDPRPIDELKAKGKRPSTSLRSAQGRSKKRSDK